MVRRALKPSLRAASCCSVEVVKGGAGFLRRCLRSIARTLSSPAVPAAAPAASSSVRSTSRACSSLVKLNCSTFSPRYSRSFNGKLCPLCEPSPAIVQDLLQVPGDRLALAIGVGGEVQRLRLAQVFRDALDVALVLVEHLVL